MLSLWSSSEDCINDGKNTLSPLNVHLQITLVIVFFINTRSSIKYFYKNKKVLLRKLFAFNPNLKRKV